MVNKFGTCLSKLHTFPPRDLAISADILLLLYSFLRVKLYSEP